VSVTAGRVRRVLERGLLARLEGAVGHARDVRVGRRGGKLGERRDPGSVEPWNLVAAQASDERQVVVPLPLS
jgi:hypothetical protein